MNWFDVLKTTQSTLSDWGGSSKEELDKIRPHKMVRLKPKTKSTSTLHTASFSSPKSPVIKDPPQVVESGQTGDEGKLNVQQATRQLQRQTRGQYQKIADEITQLGLDSRVNTKDQKKILGRIRRRLREENITEA